MKTKILILILGMFIASTAKAQDAYNISNYFAYNGGTGAMNICAKIPSPNNPNQAFFSILRQRTLAHYDYLGFLRRVTNEVVDCKGSRRELIKALDRNFPNFNYSGLITQGFMNTLHLFNLNLKSDEWQDYHTLTAPAKICEAIDQCSHDFPPGAARDDCRQNELNTFLSNMDTVLNSELGPIQSALYESRDSCESDVSNLRNALDGLISGN